MSRLIDADKLIEDLNDKNIEFDASINEIIMRQPTAYDLDKVVEQLEENSRPWTTDKGFIMMDKAMKIIKGGGE